MKSTENMSEKLEILYEDGELIVCRKPAGIPVQSAKIGQKDMVSILNVYFAEAQADRKIPPGGANRKQEDRRNCPSVHVVHRLDQPVEGVLVFAKTKSAAAGLSRQVSDGSMEKVYQAVCCAAGAETDRRKQAAVVSEGKSADGNKDYEPGREYCLVDYLVKDGRTNTSSVAEQGSRDAKRAELSFFVKETRTLGMQDCSGENAGGDRKLVLAEIRLKTGRHHQIRVQMAHAGLPLYGDRKYNESWQEFSAESDKAFGDGQKTGKTTPALCATSLSFRHPKTGKKMEFMVKPRADVFSLFSSL